MAPVCTTAIMRDRGKKLTQKCQLHSESYLEGNGASEFLRR